MTIHEFGKDNDKVIVLLHPSVVMWDYFEYVIPLLEKKYHLIIPALPGYDPDNKSDFTSVEEISAELEEWLNLNGLSNVTCLYGCSMGGSIVVRMLVGNKVNVQSAVIDGGITPYQLPWIVTRLIAVRDFLMILGVGVISIWDGFRSGFTLWQFFFRFVFIFTVYKLYDMICFDYFLLMKFQFFQFYFPEVESVYKNRKYGYNIKSQLLKFL